jgi:hypothetical protein
MSQSAASPLAGERSRDVRFEGLACRRHARRVLVDEFAERRERDAPTAPRAHEQARARSYRN